MKVTVDEKKGVIVIEAPINKEPAMSKSGKTLIVATTSGALKTGAMLQGKEVVLNLTAYQYPQPK